jgi:hypothetical protein
LKKGIFAVLIILALGGLCFAQESIAVWVKDRSDIKWDASPLDYPKSISSKDSILWVGPIEELNVYTNDQKETVLEFLCRHLSLAKAGPIGVVEPIKVRDQHTGYFVISIRTTMPLNKALEFREEMKKKSHYAAVLGQPVDRRFFSTGQLAVYVYSEKAKMSDRLRLNIIK